ncbi:MAG: MarR family EPS-associated transcriptional regulator [Halothiobacillaceae bacterium]
MPELDEQLRYRLLKKLAHEPGMTQRQLAEEIGISLGKVNYCLKALVDKGWVKMGNFRRSKHKIRYAYLLTPKGLEEKARVTVAFLQHKQREYDRITQELETLKAEVAQMESRDARRSE